jgi:hypothetical protein
MPGSDSDFDSDSELDSELDLSTTLENWSVATLEK